MGGGGRPIRIKVLDLSPWNILDPMPYYKNVKISTYQISSWKIKFLLFFLVKIQCHNTLWPSYVLCMFQLNSVYRIKDV